MQIKYTKTCTKIYDSYELKTDDSIKEIALHIATARMVKNLPQTRTEKSYCNEIKAHNRLYKWGLFKNHTKPSNVKKNKINKRNAHDEFEPITYNVDGFTLYVGKNNKQNDYITTKLGKNDDLWFHTKDIRGSHVLLKCNGSKVNDNTIVACAEIAAFYSKAKLSSNVPVDYCYIKNVKKPSGSKPGMVIYTNNQTINVNPKKI